MTVKSSGQCPRICQTCKHGTTAETEHEWIETNCELDNKWRSPWHNACERYVSRYEEDANNDTETET